MPGWTLISTAAYHPHRSSDRPVSGGAKDIDEHEKFDFVVHYGISKEEKEYELR